MKITFIRPSMVPGRAHDALEPLSLAILSALTPPEIDRAFYDDRIEEIPLDESTDVVAMTVDTHAARRAYQLARAFHERGVRVIMGGAHPTLCPREVLDFADAVVRGDAEDTWPHVVEDLRAGSLKRMYTSTFPELGGVSPDRSIYSGKRYGGLRVAQFGRGCRYRCDFCSVHAVYGDNVRQRPVADLVREIESAGARLWLLADDNLFSDMECGKALCRALKPLRVRWACQASVNVTDDLELVQLMAESGCRVLLSGFESLDAANLTQMHKGGAPAPERYEAQVRMLRDHGIMVYGTFVFGYDEDTVDTIQAALRFAQRAKLVLANFNPLMPFPGTALYDRLQDEGRLIDERWWLSPAVRIGQGLFQPKRITAEELEEACYQAKTEFNSVGSIARRALDMRSNTANLALFLSANLASRREIHRKQGLGMGAAKPLEPIHAGALL